MGKRWLLKLCTGGAGANRCCMPKRCCHTCPKMQHFLGSELFERRTVMPHANKLRASNHSVSIKGQVFNDVSPVRIDGVNRAVIFDAEIYVGSLQGRNVNLAPKRINFIIWLSKRYFISKGWTQIHY